MGLVLKLRGDVVDGLVHERRVGRGRKLVIRCMGVYR